MSASEKSVYDLAWEAASPVEREAREAGASFYWPPSQLNYDEQIDELLRDACERVNSSDWMWTAETCQGHPDYDGETVLTAWDHQTGPYFRVVVRDADLGATFALLYKAVVEADARHAGTLGFKVYPRRLKAGWNSFPIYIEAHNVQTRNAACAALEHFGEMVDREGERRRAEAER